MNSLSFLLLLMNCSNSMYITVQTVSCRLYNFLSHRPPLQECCSCKSDAAAANLLQTWQVLGTHVTSVLDRFQTAKHRNLIYTLQGALSRSDDRFGPAIVSCRNGESLTKTYKSMKASMNCSNLVSYIYTRCIHNHFQSVQ